MRVLQVTTDTDRRGGQVFACELHRRLDARGLVVRTVALAPGDVGGLHLPTLGPTRLSGRALLGLRRLMRGADVVVAHGSTTLPACAVAGAGTGTPFVYRSLGDPLQWANSRRRRVRTGALLRRAARVVALWPGSARALEQTLHVPAAKLAVVPNGVDTGRFRPRAPVDRVLARERLGLPAAVPVVAFIGALGPEKDVGNAIGAVAGLADVRLVVAGDGPERAVLERRAASSAAQRVRFLGVVDDPRDVYAAADCVVLPSRTEGLPATLIEAGLSGVPAVATDVGGISEIVTAHTGVLVPPQDVAALSAALRRVLSDRGEMGAAAVAHCRERFDLDRVADQWVAVLAAASSGRAG